MSTMLSLRIVVLQIQSEIWCDFCGVPCAITVIYLVEESGRAPAGVGRLTYCDGCDERG